MSNYGLFYLLLFFVLGFVLLIIIISWLPGKKAVRIFNICGETDQILSLDLEESTISENNSGTVWTHREYVFFYRQKNWKEIW